MTGEEAINSEAFKQVRTVEYEGTTWYRTQDVIKAMSNREYKNYDSAMYNMLKRHVNETDVIRIPREEMMKICNWNKNAVGTKYAVLVNKRGAMSICEYFNEKGHEGRYIAKQEGYMETLPRDKHGVPIRCKGCLFRKKTGSSLTCDYSNDTDNLRGSTIAECTHYTTKGSRRKRPFQERTEDYE